MVAHQNQVSVTGKRPEAENEPKYVHRGIAMRPFERRFAPADFIEVSSANFENGLLSIWLKRVVPEAMKPRTITIGVGEATQQPQAIEQTEPA